MTIIELNTRKFQREWNECLLNIKGDLQFHLDELQTALDADQSTTITAEVEKQMQAVRRLIHTYSARSDRDKQDFKEVMEEIDAEDKTGESGTAERAS